MYKRQDNNSASNGNYYNNKRTATVTITEHNFDTSRIALREESLRASEEAVQEEPIEEAEECQEHGMNLSL